MPNKKLCSYAMLAVCLVGVVVGIVFVLVVIKTLVVPLQGKHVPAMPTSCLVKDISPVAGGVRRKPNWLGAGVAAAVDPELKTEKRARMENEVDPDKCKRKHGRKRLGYESDQFGSLSDTNHRTRHWKAKIGHMSGSRTEKDGEIRTADLCYTVRVQFAADALDSDGGLTSIVREGYLKQPSKDKPLTNQLPWIQETNKSFCCNCHSQGTSDNATLIYSGKKLVKGDSVLCKDVSSRRSPAATRKTTNWLLINAMFWPTLVFILGFVGLFFAGIHVAKENNDTTDAQQPNVRTPLRQIK